ncbi:Gemini of Cajal bodies-associated protein 8 [Trinorchestia longiramus]|nr:Gemini of Cajal bodies-associated protein 8 [Trinorchestia longiramus]
MSQVDSVRSSRSRKRNKKRKQRNRSSSVASSRGPFNVADSVPQKPPWYEAVEFTRFWNHYSTLMYSTHISVLRHAADSDVCPCERQAQSCRNKRQKQHKGYESAFAAPLPPEGKWLPLSPTPNPLSPRLCYEHKLLLNSQSRRCSRARRRLNVSDRNVTSKKKAPSGGRHVASSNKRENYDATLRDGASRAHEGYGDYYDEAANYTGMKKFDSNLSVNAQEDYDYDTYYDDQESASELTSQMRGGMSLSDEQEPPVSEEFLAFMQQTIRHKEEWSKKKAAVLLQRAAAAGSALISQQGDEITLQKEHPDVVRSREMKALYGAAAPQLHAMETAVQLAFDRIATRHHAKVWPNIPINIMFSDE